MTYESVPNTQADLVKVTKSTTERKSMSTKTSIKRIALVAVAALGFGMVSTVAANAALTTAQTISATLNTATTSYAGRVGVQIQIPITATTVAAGSVSGKYSQLRFAASITTQPATSAVYAGLASGSTAPGTGLTLVDRAINLSAGSAAGLGGSFSTRTSTGDATGPASVAYQVTADNEGAGAITAGTVATLVFTPTVAGTYTAVVWNESSTSGIASLSGAESYQTFTINVADAISTVSLTAVNSTCAKDASLTGDDYGCLVKVQLKDAAGNLAIPATGETVVLTPSGAGDITYVNNSAVTSAAGAAYSLSAADFGNT